MAKTITDINTRCIKQADQLDTPEQKNVAIAKCKVSTQLRIISAIKQSITKAPTPEARIKYTRDVRRAQLRLAQYQKSLAKVMISYKRSLQSKKVQNGSPLS